MRRLVIIAWALLLPLRMHAAELTAAELSALPSADVVFLGEVHDNPSTHQNQARAIRALRPRALVFEMLTPDQARRVTPKNRRDETRLQAVLNWNATGWPDFSNYYQLFAAAPNALVFGADVARKRIKAAVHQDAARAFGKDAATFGLNRPLAADQQAAREDLQMTAHCNALPKNLLPGMVEAQRLRDASLARAALEAFEKTGGPVVVVTGNGHARNDWGAPVLIHRVSPDVSVLSVGQFESPPEKPIPFDYVVLVPPFDRPDPCAAFKS